MTLVDRLQIFALVAGGCFFLWKLFTGWLIINLSVSVRVERERKNDHIDFLSVMVTLEKGHTDSIWLKHIHGRVRPFNQPGGQLLDFSADLHRLRMQDGNTCWDEPMDDTKLTLSPGETMQTSRVVEVACGTPMSVDIAVFGIRPFWPRGFQWRTSAVSLPNR